MRPVHLRSAAEVLAAAGDDGMLAWTAQGLRPGVLAWRLGDAVAVASPDLSRRDRLAVRGSLADATELVRYALAVVGRTFRPIGDASLIRAMVARMPELALVSEFVWMESTEPTPSERAPEFHVGWLPRERLGAVAVLIDEAFPDSNAHPRQPGFRRWAGASVTPEGSPVAVAADAWSTRGIGFIAGVATARPYRGRGAARAVCGFVANTLIREEGRVALMVDVDNPPALALYRHLGFTARTVAAARVRRPNE